MTAASAADDAAARRALDAADFGAAPRVGVAVSGGPDSAGALALVAERGRRDAFPVFALHVDHGLRGAASAADAALVVEQARRLGVPPRVANADVAGELRRRPGSIELRARELRYAALSEFAGGERLTHVVFAHHLDDQEEQILLALLRGGGPDALAGIPRERALTAACRLVRPFLGVRKSALAAAAALAGLAVADDETNRSPRFRRNVVRATLIPGLRATCDLPALLAELSGAAARTAAAAALSAARLVEGPGAHREPGVLELPYDGVRRASRFVRAALLRGLFRDDPAFGGPASSSVVTLFRDGVVSAPAQALELRLGVRIDVRADRLAIFTAPARTWSVAVDPARLPFEAPLDGARSVRVERAERPGRASAESDEPADPRSCLLHVPPGSALEIRPPRTGDRFALESGEGRGRVSELLSNRKVAPQWRSRVPLVFVDGELRWIAGLRTIRRPGDDAANVRVVVSGPTPWAAAT